MNEERKPDEEVQEESTVRLNTDPAAGPLDGAEATVKAVKTKFGSNGKIRQKILKSVIHASYELGVVSVSLPDENLMLSVRIDEMTQVIYTSATANKSRREQTKKENDAK